LWNIGNPTIASLCTLCTYIMSWTIYKTIFEIMLLNMQQCTLRSNLRALAILWCPLDCISINMCLHSEVCHFAANSISLIKWDLIMKCKICTYTWWVKCWQSWFHLCFLQYAQKVHKMFVLTLNPHLIKI
jgi:hypothetical protein